MKILYDNWAFDCTKVGGVPKVFSELIGNIPKENVDIAMLATNNYDIRKSYYEKNNIYIPTHEIYEIKSNIQHNDFPIKEYNIKYALNKIKENNFDVFHETFYFDGFVDIIKKPFVFTVHDFLQDKLYNIKTCAYYKPCIDVLSKYATKIISVSETTKKDFIELYNVDESKIEVIYNGISDLPNDYKYADLNINCKYILYVGRRVDTNLVFNKVSQNYKNFIPFLSQCVQFLKEHEDVNIVCAGQAFTPFEIELLRQYNLNGRVLLAENPSEDLLNSLYHNAMCFVFPSEYEGFGMTTFEAYRNGCITLLNNIDVFKEVGCKDSLFFDITDGKSLYNQLNEVYNMSENDKKNIIKKQKQHFKKFSVDKFVNNHIKLYESL